MSEADKIAAIESRNRRGQGSHVQKEDIAYLLAQIKTLEAERVRFEVELSLSQGESNGLEFKVQGLEQELAEARLENKRLKASNEEENQACFELESTVQRLTKLLKEADTQIANDCEANEPDMCAEHSDILKRIHVALSGQGEV